MKKKPGLFLILCVSVITVMAQKPVIIDGRFTGNKPAEVKLFKVSNGVTRVIATAQSTSKGKFGFRFFPEYEGLYVVGTGSTISPAGNYKFWLKNGDQLSITLTDSSYALSGLNNTKENQALTEWYKLLGPLMWKSFYFNRVNSTYVDFFPELQQVLTTLKSGMKRTGNTGNRKFDAALKDMINLDIAYAAVNFLYTPRSAHPDKEELPEYYETISANKLFPLAASAYQYPWGNRAFGLLLMKDQLNSGQHFMNGPAGMEQGFSFIKSDTLKGDFALEQMSRLQDFGNYLEHKNIAEKYILTDAQKEKDFQIESALATLKPGSRGYEFKFEDKDGKMTAFSDLKGKVILVDMWATWCKPCREQIPYLKKLEEEMKGKAIAIVSISVDEETDKDKWKQMIKDQQLGGLQLFANGWTDMTKYYKISGIPRFLVFDKEGNIVSVDAPRPSSPELKALLEQYL